MHDQAEYGIAAHWLYKRAGNSKGNMSTDDKNIDSQISWIRRSLDWATDEEMGDATEYLNSLRVELFEDEIFVFTPKGEVMSLRRASTPLDFAYAVHTEIGNHCVGAKVNGSVAPLTYRLQSGDRVEILTNKNAKPSRDWLKLVATPSAKAKIRKYFATASKSDDADRGRGYLSLELRKHGLGISSARVTKALEKVLETTDYRDVETLLAAIGTGKVSPKMVAHRVDDAVAETRPASEIEREARKAQMAADRELREFAESDGEDDEEAEEKVSRRRRRNERPKDDVVLDAAFDVMSDLIRLNDGAEVPRPRTNSGWYNAIMGGFRE
jgi:GTP pyrophosphokinase